MSANIGFFICAFLLCYPDNGLCQQRRSSVSSSGSGTSASQVINFDCPEEFGYYPHPADCTQYYVCVFGGALLESCTGGLMYSHELQTCDWPRNVGCGSGGAPEVQVVSTAKTQEPPPRQRQQQLSRQPQQQQQQQQPQQQQQQQQQYVPHRPLQREEAIPKHHLYAEEELGPAEEVESDRQQRVYRGQPATLGQVARDRDGLSRHSNAIQITPSNGREKLSVISFGTQQQYTTDSETKRHSSTEALHRLKRQVKFSFPGDTRGYHPSASTNLGTWAASSPFALPFPPPAPSWPPPIHHYSQDSGQYINKHNVPPLLHAPTSQFSRPFRFPIKDNEEDFVPVVGKGVKLPKPSPELLITPSSVEKTPTTSQQPINQFLPPNQPDNYAFFNLETLPRNNAFNATVHHVIVLSSNNTSPVLPNLYLLPSVGTNKDFIQETASSLINKTQINNNSNIYWGRDKSINSVRNDSFAISQKPNVKPSLNLTGSASHSEESQLAPPSRYQDNEHNGYNRHRPIKPNNEKQNSKKRLNISSDNFNNRKKNTHSDSGGADDGSKQEPSQTDEDNSREDGIQEDNEERKGGTKRNKPQLSVEEDIDSSFNFESPAFPSPPKEFFDEPSKNYKDDINPFSDPDFDFDKFFDDFTDDSSQPNKHSQPQYHQQSQEISHEKVNDFDKNRNSKYKQNQDSDQVPYKFGSDSQKSFEGPTHTTKSVYKVNKYITEAPQQIRGIPNHKKLLWSNNDPRHTSSRLPNVDSIPYLQSSEENHNRHPSSKHTSNAPIGTKTAKLSGFLSKNNYNSDPQTVPRNHKNNDNLFQSPTPHTFNFTNNFNSFYGDSRNKNYYSSRDPKYGSSSEEPTLYTVHRQNSLSSLPYKNHSRYKDEDEGYDDEEYYDSNEEYDYFDEDTSLENLHSPKIKPIKPPNVPNKLKNIDSMSFEKAQGNEEYDDTSEEKEDEDDHKVSYSHEEEVDCRRKYKNHKCTQSDNTNKKYEEDTLKNNDYDYDYDEEQRQEQFIPPKNGQYEVVEDIAESQQSLIKSNLDKNAAPIAANYTSSNSAFPKNNITSTINKSRNLNFHKHPDFETSTVFLKPKNQSTSANIQSQVLQSGSSSKLQHNQIPQEILLKALSDKRTTHLPVNRTSGKGNKFKPFPKVTDSNGNTKLQERIKQNSSQMTSDSTKLNFSSTSPHSPKSLKDFRQRPLTKPTNLTSTGDIETSGTLDQPMTLLTSNSHLTNSLTIVGRQNIALPQYVEQATTTRATGRGYNSTQQQQQQYTPSPYDPYYNIYEDDSDLYKDIDYSQYQGQQYQSQPKPPVQQQVQAPPPPSPSRKPSLQYTPSPPSTSYNAVQQDVYNQAQDYSDNYNLQDEDIDYKQADIDVKGNRSRTAKRQDPAKPTTSVENVTEKQVEGNLPLNRRLTLTASFSFDNNKTPVTSSRKLETNSRQRPSLNSFQVEDPPSSGPQRDTHELVLSYIRLENAANNQSKTKQKEAETKPKTYALNTQTLQRELSPSTDPKRYTYYLPDLETSEISSTIPPESTESAIKGERNARPFRIVVPSSTAKPTDSTTTEETTLRSNFYIRRGNKHYEDRSELSTTTNSVVETVKPYKLPPLSRETIDITLQQSRLKAIQALEKKTDDVLKTLKETQETLKRKNLIYNNHSGISNESPSESTKGDSQFKSNNINYSQELPDEHPPQRFASTNEENVDEKSIGNLVSDASPSTGSRYSHRLVTTPSVEESVVKLIPIKPVRSRFQYEGKLSEDDAYNKPTEGLPLGASVKNTQHSYQVTEENFDLGNYTPPYVPLSRFQQKKTESETRENANALYSKESLSQINSRNINNNLQGRQLTRIQTTEKPAQKSLYSLRIDNNGGKFKGEVGGLVLATLEAITVSPEKSDKTSRNSITTPTNTSKSISSTEKDNQDNDQPSTHNSTPGVLRSYQIRMRSQGRIYTQHNTENIKEYQYSPYDYTSTESYENEEFDFVPVRTPSSYRTPARTESTIINETSETTEGKQVTEASIKQENRDTQSYPSTDFNHKDTIGDRKKQFTKRLRYRNRLETETEVEGSDQIDVDKEVSDEGSSDLADKRNENRIQKGEGSGNNEPSPNYDEYQFTNARQFWKTTSSSNDDQSTDDVTEDIQEVIKRRQNMRRMQIRKKIKITTAQPEIASPETTEEVSTSRPSRFQTEQPQIKYYVTENLSTTRMPSRFQTEQPQVRYYKTSSSDSDVSSDDLSKTSKKENESTEQRDQSDFTRAPKKGTTDDGRNRENYQITRERGRLHSTQKENSPLKPNFVPLVVDPYTLISSSLSNDNKASNRTTLYHQTTPNTNIVRSNRFETKASIGTESNPPIAAEINSYFRGAGQNTSNVQKSIESTTPYTMTTVEKIRDKFRLGTFPKPVPSSNSFSRKPSVEDNTPPPLLSDKCSQELDSDADCGDKPLLRVRPVSASPESQSTPGLTRGSSRNRGSATYTVSPNEAEPSPRGTPSSLSRGRPTLKPSTSIVSKASEFVDIYRYPPSRPEPIYPTPQADKTAAKCRKDVCLLPDCSCGGKEIPGDLPVEETPQIVLLTFDDSVNDLNKGLYSDLFEKGRTNPNGCPISATFYVSHEWTDYSQVQNLYAGGHEIASHSVSHSFGEQFSVKKWTKEIAGQREILAAYGGVRQEDIRGMRAPFLAIGGNKMFKMLHDSNFTYDSSMPVYENKPPSWPYTLDYKIFHDCMIPPCPTRSYPGVWEVPMVMWQDLNGGRCSMGDACSNPPAADGVYKMLIKNFERHFTSNRSPFGLFYHAAWFTQPHHKEGFIAFLDTITKMPEVWLVTNWQAIQWVRDPTPISRLNGFAPFGCNYPERPRKCMNPKVCNLWHKSGVRYMRTCQPCPDIYPWTGKTGVRNSRVDNEIITE